MKVLRNMQITKKCKRMKRTGIKDKEIKDSEKEVVEQEAISWKTKGMKIVRKRTWKLEKLEKCRIMRERWGSKGWKSSRRAVTTGQ